MSPVTIHWIVTGSPLYFVVLELEHLIATEPTQFRVFGDVHHRPQWRHCPLRAGMLWWFVTLTLSTLPCCVKTQEIGFPDSSFCSMTRSMLHSVGCGHTNSGNMPLGHQYEDQRRCIPLRMRMWSGSVSIAAAQWISFVEIWKMELMDGRYHRNNPTLHHRDKGHWIRMDIGPSAFDRFFVRRCWSKQVSPSISASSSWSSWIPRHRTTQSDTARIRGVWKERSFVLIVWWSSILIQWTLKFADQSKV